MLVRVEFPTVTVKKKTRLLTGNLMRNLHWGTLSKVKREYSEYTEKLAKSLPGYKTVTVHYTLYFSNKRKKDIDNMIWPLHKFLMDSWVKNGNLSDDDHTIVTGFSAHFGGYADDDYVMMELEGEEI